MRTSVKPLFAVPARIPKARSLPGSLSSLLLVLALLPSPGAAQPQMFRSIKLSEPDMRPESITSGKDGSVYFGSMASGTIYRAAPGAAVAEPWIRAESAGLSNVLGVLAHDASNTLWVCQNSTGGSNGAPVVGQTALRSFDLATGEPRASYPFPGNGGLCNDIAVADDGTVYATETVPNRIIRLRPGAAAVDVWFSDSRLGSADGIALLSDGAVYTNGFRGNGFFRIPVNADGSAGTLEVLETTLPLDRPDGLRPVGPDKLLQAEQGGRLAELTIKGNRAEMRVIQTGLTRASALTLVGDEVVVLLDFESAVRVPYKQ